MFNFLRKRLLREINVGLADLKNIAERVKKHENSVSLMNACMNFSVLSKVDIVREQLDSAYLRHKIKLSTTKT